jgi:hypothetical protein
VLRNLAARLLVIGLVAQGCASDRLNKLPPGMESTGGASGGGGTGGAAGTGGSTGGAGGGGGLGGSGGMSGSGGPGGGGGESMDAGDPDVAPAPDAPAGDSAELRDGGFLGIIPDGQPWQRQCPEGTPRRDCCALYCGCMATNCPATLPKDCQTACESAGNWDLVCRNYQCFASKNPHFPQDHDSHCQHAIGQLGKCGNH